MKKWTAVLLLMSLLSCLCLPASAEEEKALDGCVLVTFGASNTALSKLGELLHIPREEMIAMGDGANDLELIAYAGLGIAMGNATEAVKKKAPAVTKTNDEDGVAEAIRKYLL